MEKLLSNDENEEDLPFEKVDDTPVMEEEKLELDIKNE